MRPKYETELDRLREERVANIVAAHQDSSRGGDPVVVTRCRSYYPCDWVLIEEKSKPLIFALLEVKIRDRQYDTYMLSLSKASQITHMAAYAQAEPLLAVYWEDIRKVGIVNLMQCSREVGIGGRLDRVDKDDIEPVIYIPTREFSLIEPRMIV